MKRVVKISLRAKLPEGFTGTLADALEWLAQWERDNPDPVALADRIALNDPMYIDTEPDPQDPEAEVQVKALGTWIRDPASGDWTIWR